MNPMATCKPRSADAALPPARRKGRRTKKAAGLLLALCLLAVLSLPAAAADTYTEGGFEYTIADESVTIVGYFGDAADVAVPSMLAGYPVNTIAAGAFLSGRVQTLRLPDSITTIENGAIRAGITIVYNANISGGDPTVAPSASPTAAPTASPTAAPTASPSAAPTASPTANPTASPTAVPTAVPTPVPTAASAAQGPDVMEEDADLEEPAEPETAAEEAAASPTPLPVSPAAKRSSGTGFRVFYAAAILAAGIVALRRKRRQK